MSDLYDSVNGEPTLTPVMIQKPKADIIKLRALSIPRKKIRIPSYRPRSNSPANPTPVTIPSPLRAYGPRPKTIIPKRNVKLVSRKKLEQD